MSIKKILSLVTSALLLISASNIKIDRVESFPISENSLKLSEELKEIIERADDSDIIQVGVKFTDLDHSIIDDMITKKSDYCIEKYKDIDSYRNTVLLDIIKSTEEKYGYEKSHVISLRNVETGDIFYASDIFYNDRDIRSRLLLSMDYDKRSDLIVSCVPENELKRLADNNFGMSLISKNVNEDINAYMKVRRECVSEAYKNYNLTIISDYADSENIVVNAEFAPYVIVELNKEMIMKLCSNDSVIELSYSSNNELKSDFSDACEVTRVTETQGLGYNDSHGYTGVGVGVGIIEAESGRYDNTYCMLNGCDNLQYLHNYHFNYIEDVNNHATQVTSIIKGKRYVYNGTTYRGVAPDSNVIQTTCNFTNQYANTITTLAGYGVSVINNSNGYSSASGYTSDDWLVDQAINNYGIVFVSSAGNIKNGESNTIKVVTPGKAYNAITVGNLNTTTNYPYTVSSSSSYQQNSDHPNKPDLCAPGTNLVLPGVNGAISGTSFSAPIVTGIIAQMLQCDPTLRLPAETINNETYYYSVKSIILLGSNPNAVSTYNNPVNSGPSVSSLMREKTGVGLVDSKKTIDLLLNNGLHLSLQNFYLDSNGTAEGGMSRVVSFRAGTKLRIILYFTKNNQYYNSNLDLKLYNSNMNPLAYSTSLYNNVEVIEYTIPEGGNYYIQTSVVTNSVLSNDLLACTLAICRE